MISVHDKLPEQAGYYKVQTTSGEAEVFYARQLNRKLVWVVPDPSTITHWQPKK